jgi:hypothetical protein
MSKGSFFSPSPQSVADRFHASRAVLTLAFVVGCANPEVCPALGTCGGDLAGSVDHDADGAADSRWIIGGACLNEVFVSSPNASLINQPPPVQGKPPPEQTHANWCSEVVIKADKTISKINPWFPALPLRDGAVTYSANGTFNVQINYFALQNVDFPRGCFETQGFTIVPEGTAPSSNTLTCAEFNTILAERLSTEPNIQGVACGDDDDGGCLCVYNLLMVTGSNGTWTTDGTVVNHYDKVTGETVSRADYCVSGDTLELSGHHRTFLFNQPHLRSLVLTRE